jgi:hypothetical protein
MLDSNSFTFIETKNYTIRLEYNEDYVIAHLPQAKITKETVIDMKSRLGSWYNFFKTAGYKGIYAAAEPDKIAIAKLLFLLNFKFQGHSDGMDVYFYGDN